MQTRAKFCVWLVWHGFNSEIENHFSAISSLQWSFV